MDNQSEIFNYTYHNYQQEAKHMMRVQAALKNDKRVPDALQTYWVRKVADRWYANVGKYNVRLKLRKIEQIYDEIRKQILKQPTLDGMIAMHEFYLKQIDPSVLDIECQIEAVNRIVSFLQEKGFRYEDSECKIRYSFLNPEECNSICDFALTIIQETIQNHEPSCQIECEPKGSIVKDAGFFWKLAFDYCERTCTLTQFAFVLG